MPTKKVDTSKAVRAARSRLPKSLTNVDVAFLTMKFDALEKEFPELATTNWQDPTNYSFNATFIDEYIKIFSSSQDDSKGKDVNFRTLQAKCWEAYKTFGPLTTAVDNKADNVCGAGFETFSEELSIRQFVKFVWLTNKMWRFNPSVMIRMLVENEHFTLIALDDSGLPTIRTTEPILIGQGTDDGLITDPDDVTQTLFYSCNFTKGKELIPDARFILEPDDMIQRTKNAGSAVDTSLINKLTLNNKFKKATGGYRRFILHWKNLTGENNIRRDTSYLMTTLEWINLYIKAIKWELDYKKALCVYTIEIRFTDTSTGKLAWMKWNAMTPAQQKATGLTGVMTPGSRVFLMPGMELHISAPVLNQLSGSNQDLLDLAGASSRTPQDMFGGKSNQPYASIRASRPPMVMDIENLQWKFQMWHQYELMHLCLTAASKIGKKVTYAGKDYKINPFYKERIVKDWQAGQSNLGDAACLPCEKILYSFPAIVLDDQPDQRMNAYLGSKHAGAYSLGASAETIAKKVGISGLPKQKERQAIEQEKWGLPTSGGAAERAIEKGVTGATPPAAPGTTDPNAPPAGTDPNAPPGKTPPAKPSQKQPGQGG